MNPATELRLGDIASRQVLTVPPEQPLREVIELFAARRVSSVVVVEQRRPIGIVTERDLLRLACSGYRENRPVRAAMSAPLTTARADLDFSSGHALLSSHGIRHLVLVDAAGDLVGVASETDFRRHIGNDLFASIQTLHAVMEPAADMLPPDLSLAEVLETMAAHRLDHVLIGEHECARGIITERDIPRLLAAHIDPEQVTAGAVMSQPLRTVPGDIAAADAARRMTEEGLRHLIVLASDGRAIGVVSQHRMLERLSTALMERGRDRLAGQLDLLLEMTGVGTWEYDHRLDRTQRSPALNKMLGFPAGHGPEPLAAICERIADDDRGRVATLLAEFRSGTRHQLNVEYLTRDARGLPRWVSVRGRQIESTASGEPLRSAGVAIDINEQKLAEQKLLASEKRFRSLLENLPLAICHINAEGEITFINQRFIADFGYTPADLPHLANWWQLAVPDPDARQLAVDRWNDASALAAQDGEVIRPGDFEICCKDGSLRSIEISGIVIDEEILASFVDVTERRAQQRLLEFGNNILQLISVGSELPTILDRICREIEAHDPQMHCSLLLLDEDGVHLRHGAAPSLPPSYCALTDGIEIGPEVGSCGSAAYLAREIFSPDLSSDPRWQNFRDLVTRHGLAACWSSPILSTEGKVLGTFGIYWRQAQPVLTPQIRRDIAAATSLAAIAIERQRRDTAVLRLHQSLSRAESIGQIGSWRWDLQKRKAYWSPQMYHLFGLDPTQPAPDFEQFVRLVHPDDQTRVRTALNQILAGSNPPQAVYRRHPDLGPVRYLQPSYTTLYDANRQAYACEGTLVDVTAAVQNEERLRQQLDELRRWQKVMLGRESRVLELKREINALLARHGEAPRYGSVETGEELPCSD
ncbi:CBS domain-containing protein [Dechloromonas sp. ZY10]|uniref:CBS domain-containing protein n=1 Tax=Dechloromonas aquae TaxID=2664436 RepID=UPI00352928F5